jgi:hypothetical protein
MTVMKGPFNHIKPIDNIFAEFSDPILDEATGILLGFRQVRLLGIFRAAFKGAFVLTSETWSRGAPAVSIRVLLAASGSEYGNPLSGEFLVGTKLIATLTASEIGHPSFTRTEEFIVPASETTIDKVGISLAGSFGVAVVPNHIKPIDLVCEFKLPNPPSGTPTSFGAVAITTIYESAPGSEFTLESCPDSSGMGLCWVQVCDGSNEKETSGDIPGQFIVGQTITVRTTSSDDTEVEPIDESFVVSP